MDQDATLDEVTKSRTRERWKSKGTDNQSKTLTKHGISGAKREELDG